jgi:hypothetical protein
MYHGNILKVFYFRRLLLQSAPVCLQNCSIQIHLSQQALLQRLEQEDDQELGYSRASAEAGRRFQTATSRRSRGRVYE